MSLLRHMGDIVGRESDRIGGEFDPKNYRWVMDRATLDNIAWEAGHVHVIENGNEVWGIPVLICAPIPPAKHIIQLVRQVEDFFDASS